jgi:hypothetical protein
MKRRTILLGLLLSVSSLAFSATTTDPELLKIPSIKMLSEKVDAQAQKVKAAATGSRSAGQEAQAQLTAAYKEYAAELAKQKELAGDASLKTAIDKELQVVNAKLETNATSK